MRRSLLLFTGLLLLLVALSVSASADPDPPKVDGGNVTFAGDWTVDPGDVLTYVNQTIVLDGNLTVSPNGLLELVNCTLWLNLTPPEEYLMGGVRVGTSGTLEVTAGSRVDTTYLAFFIADPGAHLLIEDSTVAHIGHTSPMDRSGLYTRADDTVLRRCTIVGGNRGLIMDGVKGSVVEDTAFTQVSRAGLYVTGDATDLTLRNLSFDSQMESVVVTDCRDVALVNVTIDRPGYGLGLDNGSVILRNVSFIDVVSEAIVYWTHGSVQWLVDGESWLVNSTAVVNGSVDVATGGSLHVVNSTLSMLNPTAHGQNDILVRPGGEMRVRGGSTVRSAPGGFSYEFSVEDGGLLVLDGAEVVGAGWGDGFPGLVIRSSGNTINDTAFTDCHTGLTVTAEGNDGTHLEFSNCTVGANWTAGNASLTDLSFSDCGLAGLRLEDAVNITIDECWFDVPAAAVALYAYRCTGLRANDVTVNRSLLHAVQLLGCSQVSMVSSNLVAGGAVLNVDGMGTGSDLTFEAITILNASRGVDITSVSDLVLRNVTVEASSVCVKVTSTSGLVIVGCSMGGTALSGLDVRDSTDMTVVQSRVNGTGQLVHVENTTGLFINECLLTGGGDGLTLVRVVDGLISNITAIQVDDGLYFDGTSNITALGCIVDTDSSLGVMLHDCDGTTLGNLTVIDAPIAVRVEGGNGTVVSGLVLSNVVSGLIVEGPSNDNVLRDSTMSGLPVAVRVRTRVNLTVEDCSFLDCPLAISGDVTSNVTYRVSSVRQISTSNCSLRGWFTVTATGTLNVTASHISFLGDSSTDCRVEAMLGSTLRLLDGTVVEGPGVPFSILAAGNLLVRNVTIEDGGEVGGMAALASSGSVVSIANSTFRDCALALSLAGTNPIVRDCVFENNRQSVRLDGVSGPRFTDCAFGHSNASWDIHGIFTSNMRITGCSFDGGGTTAVGLNLDSPVGPKASLVLTDVSISNYTKWGLLDEHFGSLLMNGCALSYANLSTGDRSTDSINLTDVQVIHGIVHVGPAGFSVSDCAFTNASFHVQDNSGGSLLTRCTFDGSMGTDVASIDVDGSIAVTLTDLDMNGVHVGVRVCGGSDVTLVGVISVGATGTGLEVNGSIVRVEGCRFRDLEGTGVRVWSPGSRVEFRNGTIQGTAGRTGHDVDASGGGDAWLLNTTFDRTSVLSTGAGRVEVVWYVTVEPRLPWGGTLVDPDFLTVVDASGVEVVNTSRADGVLRLYEFSEVDGTRTMRTPHTVNVSDAREGVYSTGQHTIDGRRHIVINLLDVAAPVARAGPDDVVDEDLKVTLNASASSDNDPTFITSGSFRWSFDEYGNDVVLDGMVVSHVFSVPGKYYINLTVWDLAGNVGTDTVIIQVRDVTSPVIRFGGNRTEDEDAWVIFDASGTTDNDPSFNLTTGTFLWRFELGTEVLERHTATFSHAFGNPGNFSGTLSVWDRAGNLAQEAFWVHVRDITPPVIISVDSATVFEATEGLLDASACIDNVAIVTYSWTVVYLNTSDGPEDEVRLDGATPSYPFERLGTYMVNLVLSDAAGNTNSTDVTIVFDDVPEISLPGWAVSMAGQRLEVPINVSTVYFTDLTVTVVEGPSTVIIEGPPTSAVMAWVPGTEHEDSQVVITVQVHDGFVASQATIDVRVNPARGPGNGPPVVLSTPPIAAKKETPYIYSIDAEDPDGDVLGYLLVAGPAGMTISQGGTVSWDPPFDRGTVLVDVHLRVTDGMDSVDQSWTIRWREPPNASPLINFQLLPQEVRIREEFLVDLSVYVQDPGAYDVDADDPNHVLVWDVDFDDTRVTLVSRDGMVFRFQAMDVKGPTLVNFTASDPSGAQDTALMDLVVKGRPTVTEDETPWMLWLALGVLLVVAIAGGAVASGRRRRGGVYIEPHEVEAPEADGPELGPPPEPSPEEARRLATAMEAGEAGDPSSFVEVETPARVAKVVVPPGGGPEAPAVSRVVSTSESSVGRRFAVEGLAVLEANGSVLASTGKVEETIGPFNDSIEEVRRGLRGDGLAVLELRGHRVLVALRSGLGAICIVRGREDDTFRNGLRDQLGSLLKDRSTEGALGVLEDILASAGEGATADVVSDAWTARLDSELTYQGSVVLLDLRLRNDTDHILNNVRVRLDHDPDALSVQSVTPKLLTSHGRMALGNVPPRKEHKVAISLMPELCMSSKLRVLVTYTDMEGRTVHVPTPTMVVEVECPYIEGGGEMEEEMLLSISETGLGYTGRRVFNYGMDVDHEELYRLAVALVAEQGAMKVLDIKDESLMRAEAWFLGTGGGDSSQVLVRAADHGADHMLELFVTSDDGAVTTGLLTHLAGETMDRAASSMPGKRVERVRDAATLEELAVWPTLLDYRIMGE